MRLHRRFARVGDGWEWDDSKGPTLPDFSDPLTVQAVLLLAPWGCDWLTCQPLPMAGESWERLRHPAGPKPRLSLRSG